MNEYRSGDLAELFGISRESVRRWTIEYQEYLSSDASPETEGKHRVYNDNDLRVFAVVTRLKGENHSDDEIHATLKAGQRGDLPSLLSQNSTLSTNMQLTIARQEISNLQAQLEDAMAQAQEWRDKANKLEGQLNERLSKEEVMELHKKIARLELLLEMAKGKSDE